MIITYFRSSSYTKWDFCPQQYFIIYNLGLPEPTNKKAEMGTITHKVLECLGSAKKCIQDGVTSFEDDALGLIDFGTEKTIFKDSFVNHLHDLSWKYYTGKSENRYKTLDYYDVRKWAFTALRYKGGIFDPRKRKIVAPELSFDFEIDEPWADYEYELHNGEILKGKLRLKGTIDLVTEELPGVYESTDWKTGRDIDWATGQQKDYKKLTTDAQLRFYHYALTNAFPDIKQFVPTIYFINTGGPYTMPFGPEDIETTKRNIKCRFEKIKKNKRPSLIKYGSHGWKCEKLCHFGKTEHPSGAIDRRTGECHTICSYLAEKIREQGMDTVLKEDKIESFEFDTYKNPGE